MSDSKWGTLFEEWPPKPTGKDVRMQELISASLGHSHNIYDRADCWKCGATGLRPEDFNSGPSRVEFRISRLCQSCQDAVFLP